MPRPASAEPPTAVACLGASITFGFGLADRRRECYPAVLQRRLGGHVAVRNFGHSGAAVSARATLPYRVTPAFGAAERFSPSACVLMLGTNDAQHANLAAIDGFEEDLHHLVETISAWPRAPHVLLVNPPPLFPPLPEFCIETLDGVIRPAICRTAKARGLPCINAYTPLIHRAGWFPDRLHPGAEGAAAIAGLVEPPLREAIGLPAAGAASQ